MELLEALRLAGDAFVAAVDAAHDDVRARRSVCDEWTVDELIAHVVGGCAMAVALSEGSTTEVAVTRASYPIPSTSTSSLRRALAGELTALAAPGLADLIVHHPMLDMTGHQLLETRIIELTVHGWDLRRSLGIDDMIDERLAQIAWASIAPLADRTSSLGVFGTGSTGRLGHTASAAARLLDATGRRP